MRLQSIAAVALVFALAGMASASIVTLDVVVANSNLSMDGKNGPTSTSFEVWASVSQNSSTYNSITYNFGLKGWSTNLTFTSGNGGQITVPMDLVNWGEADAYGAATINSVWTQGLSTGNLVNSSGVITPYGTGGLNVSSGAVAVPTGTSWRTVGSAAYNTVSQGNALFGAGKILLFSSTIDAVAAGDITITGALRSTGTRLFNQTSGTLSGAVVPTTLVNDTAVIHVAAAAPSTTPPTVTIDTADVTEAAWTQQPGWNNPLHTVHIAATGSAGTTEGDAAQTLTWLWQVTNNNGVTKNLAATTASFDLTIGELATLFAADGGLPGPYASGTNHATDPAYNWTLKATVSDGVDSPNGVDTMTIFVPEPTTIGLLGFGIVGAIMRRRRA